VTAAIQAALQRCVMSKVVTFGLLTVAFLVASVMRIWSRTARCSSRSFGLCGCIWKRCLHFSANRGQVAVAAMSIDPSPSSGMPRSCRWWIRHVLCTLQRGGRQSGGLTARQELPTCIKVAALGLYSVATCRAAMGW